MVVAHFSRRYGSHDCWGRDESYSQEYVQEFKNIDSWLAFRQKNPNITVLAVYDVKTKIM